MRVAFMRRAKVLATFLIVVAGTTLAPAQVRVTKNVMVPARDGVRLATDVHLPAAEGAAERRYPAILLRTPYNKSGFAAEVAETFAKHGYAVAVQDVRGRFASEGTFYIYLHEGQDGFDAVEWVAKQPWCDGRVATYGQSYLAATQQALAVLRPPHLKAMFVLVGTSSYMEDGAGRGGAVALLHNMAYAFRMAQTGKEAASNKVTEAALREANEKLGDWLRASPLKPSSPLSLAPSYQTWYSDWQSHPPHDSYWKQNGYNFEDRLEQLPDTPVCFVGGWYDIFKRGTLRNFDALTRNSLRKAPTRLLMGPWTHETGISFAGDVDFGPEAKLDLRQEALRWFDQYLKGQDRGLEKEPRVRYFLMGGDVAADKTAIREAAKNKDGRLQSGGQWKTADTWPPRGVREVRLHLHHHLETGGSLRREVCRGGPNSTFEFSPEDPVPTIGGNIDSGKDLVRRGAQNQVLQAGDYGATNRLPLSARRDVLVFETPPLERDLEVVGPMRAELWVSSSAKDTDITAKLIDVFPPSADYPGGYAMNVEDGILRLRYREGRAEENLLTPGAAYKATVDLWSTAIVFRRGHKIRIDISSSNFPMYDVNPNTGEPVGRHTHTVKAINNVFHYAQRPSALVLSVMESGPEKTP